MQQNKILKLLESYECTPTEYKKLENQNGFIIYSKATIDCSDYKELKKYYTELYKNINERNIFRYFYYKNLQNKNPLHATIIMMNPAFADSEEPDDTIKNIVTFINDYNNTVKNNEKIGSFDIVNLFPIRMPKSAKLNELLKSTETETKNYQKFVKYYLENFCNNNIIIAAWGSKYNAKAKNLFKEIEISNLKCYAQNKCSPKHFGSMAFNTIKTRELLDYNII